MHENTTNYSCVAKPGNMSRNSRLEICVIGAWSGCCWHTCQSSEFMFVNKPSWESLTHKPNSVYMAISSLKINGGFFKSSEYDSFRQRVLSKLSLSACISIHTYLFIYIYIRIHI